MNAQNSNDAGLAYQIDGDPNGDWVTFIPGIANDIHFWDEQVSYLATDFRILRFDLPGHGNSPDRGAYSFQMLSESILALWDAIGIKKAHVVGLGFGGSTALSLASIKPERAISLTACCCRARMTPDFAQAWKQRLQIAENEGIEAIVESTAQRWFTPSFQQSNKQTLASTRDMIRRMELAGYRHAIHAFLQLEIEFQVDRIGAPTLLIGGGADQRGGPRDVMAALARKIKNARHDVIEGVGHLVNLEAPQVFNLMLSDFLREKRSPQ